MKPLVINDLERATNRIRALAELCRKHPELRPELRRAVRALPAAVMTMHKAILPPKTLIIQKRPTRPRNNYEQGTMAKALLLEIILRAASDWVLYRTHRRQTCREWANDAYVWLFEEKPGHPNWEERAANGKHLTSFIAICEALDFEPELVRDRIRTLTPQRIVSMGRPAEYRRKRVVTSEVADESDVRSFLSESHGDLGGVVGLM